MTRVICAISWFDESPQWLAATVASSAKFCDHVVAVDGAYALYPDARRISGTEQHEALIETCNALDLGLTLHVPRTPWLGGEVEKRTRLMQLGAMEGEHGKDWVCVLDADEIVESAPSDVLARLTETEYHAGYVTLVEREDHTTGDIGKIAPLMVVPREFRCTLRIFYRCLPGLRLEGRHYAYTADGPDGEPIRLWDARSGVVSMADAVDLSDVQVEHRNTRRPKYRRMAAKSYYETRDRLGIESSPDEEV